MVCDECRKKKYCGSKCRAYKEEGRALAAELISKSTFGKQIAMINAALKTDNTKRYY